MAEPLSRSYLLIWFLSSSAASFFLHYSWEKFQCTPFFIHGAGGIEAWPMVAAALGDLVLTWFAYSAVAVLSKSWRWVVLPWKLKQWAIIVTLALVLSIGFELIAFQSGRWSYTAENPVLPMLGVSILPVLQLLILFPLSFYLWRSLLRRLEHRSGRAEFK